MGIRVLGGGVIIEAAKKIFIRLFGRFKPRLLTESVVGRGVLYLARQVLCRAHNPSINRPPPLEVENNKSTDCQHGLHENIVTLQYPISACKKETASETA